MSAGAAASSQGSAGVALLSTLMWLWVDSLPHGLLDRGSQLFAGYRPEVTPNSLPCGPLQRGSLLYQSTQAKKEIERGAAKAEDTVICNLIMEVTSQHPSYSTHRSKSLGPVQTHRQEITHGCEYWEGGVILGGYSPHALHVNKCLTKKEIMNASSGIRLT